MFKATQIKPINEEEKLFMCLPFCTCSACTSLYNLLKQKIDKNRFDKLDVLRKRQYM